MFWVVDLLPVSVGSGGVYGVSSVLGGRSLTCLCCLLGGLYRQHD